MRYTHRVRQTSSSPEKCGLGRALMLSGQRRGSVIIDVNNHEDQALQVDEISSLCALATLSFEVGKQPVGGSQAPLSAQRRCERCHRRIDGFDKSKVEDQAALGKMRGQNLFGVGQKR